MAVLTSCTERAARLALVSSFFSVFTWPLARFELTLLAVPEFELRADSGASESVPFKSWFTVQDLNADVILQVISFRALLASRADLADVAIGEAGSAAFPPAVVVLTDSAKDLLALADAIDLNHVHRAVAVAAVHLHLRIFAHVARVTIRTLLATLTTISAGVPPVIVVLANWAGLKVATISSGAKSAARV